MDTLDRKHLTLLLHYTFNQNQNFACFFVFFYIRIKTFSRSTMQQKSLQVQSLVIWNMQHDWLSQSDMLTLSLDRLV